MSCSRNTVKKWIRRCEETGDVQRKVGSGMKKKTTPAQDARLLMAIAAKPITSLQELKGNQSQSYFFFVFITSHVFVADVCELPVHTSTISRRLNVRAIHARVPAVKEFLTADQKAQRLHFAQSYADKTSEWWSKVIFSDEKTFG